MREVVRRITVVGGPVSAEATVFSLTMDHVIFMFRPARFKIDRRATILFLMEGALQQVDQVGCTTVCLFMDFHWSVVVVRHDRCGAGTPCVDRAGSHRREVLHNHRVAVEREGGRGALSKAPLARLFLRCFSRAGILR